MVQFESLRQSLLQVVQQFDTWGVFRRLLFNESMGAGMSPEGTLRMMGWIHLYTASGIHIYALLEGTEWFIKRIKLKNSSVILPVRWALRLVLLLLLFFLWALQDFRFGFLRPLFMFGLRQWGLAMGLKWNFLAPLTLTFLFDLIIGGIGTTPFRLLLDSRAHFYLAVGGGALALEWLAPHLKKSTFKGVLSHLVLAIASWVGIAAIELLEDHHVALFTPFWTLISLPLFCTLIYPVMILLLLFYVFFSFPGIIIFGHYCAGILTFLISMMDRFGLTFLVISKSVIAVSFGFALVVTVAFFLLKSPRYRVGLIVVTLFFSMLFRSELVPFVNVPETRVVQLDVGQGDSLLVQRTTREGTSRTEMIDVGTARKVKPELWLSQFSREGVTGVDGILLSHLDEDHQGALRFLPLLIPIGCVETHADLWNSEKGSALSARVLREQDGIRITDHHCVELIDHTWLPAGHHGKGNELMAGSLIELGADTVYLAAGDADESQEERYYQFFKEKISHYAHRIWKVSHHGSRFSSSMDVLKNIRPEVAWISVGAHNSYHHPHPFTLLKLTELGIPFHRTDLEGAISERGLVRSNPNQPSFSKTD